MFSLSKRWRDGFVEENAWENSLDDWVGISQGKKWEKDE